MIGSVVVDVGEREHAFRVEVILAVAFGAARLREAVVHVDAVARGDPLHHAVEHDLAVLGLVEAEVAEVVQHAAGLRRDFGVDARDVAGQRVRRAGVVLRLVAKERVPVADRGEADAVDRRILRGVREFVDVVRRRSRAGGRARWPCPSALYAQPVAGTTCGASSRCTRCVSVAFDWSSVAAG